MRTTADKVKLLLTDVDVPEGTTVDAVLAPHIETANSLVTQHCATVTTYTDATLELIERWLSAHFYLIMTGQLLGETVGPITETYLWKTGYGLNQTRQGQQAMLLDSAGGLARLNAGVASGTLGMTFGFDYVGERNGTSR